MLTHITTKITAMCLLFVAGGCGASIDTDQAFTSQGANKQDPLPSRYYVSAETADMTGGGRTRVYLKLKVKGSSDVRLSSAEPIDYEGDGDKIGTASWTGDYLLIATREELTNAGVDVEFWSTDNNLDVRQHDIHSHPGELVFKATQAQLDSLTSQGDRQSAGLVLEMSAKARGSIKLQTVRLRITPVDYNDPPYVVMIRKADLKVNGALCDKRGYFLIPQNPAIGETGTYHNCGAMLRAQTEVFSVPNNDESTLVTRNKTTEVNFPNDENDLYWNHQAFIVTAGQVASLNNRSGNGQWQLALELFERVQKSTTDKENPTIINNSATLQAQGSCRLTLTPDEFVLTSKDYNDFNRGKQIVKDNTCGKEDSLDRASDLYLEKLTLGIFPAFYDAPSAYGIDQ